jgi:hypothetical protein
MYIVAVNVIYLCYVTAVYVTKKMRLNKKQPSVKSLASALNCTYIKTIEDERIIYIFKKNGIGVKISLFYMLNKIRMMGYEEGMRAIAHIIQKKFITNNTITKIPTHYEINR